MRPREFAAAAALSRATLFELQSAGFTCFHSSLRNHLRLAHCELPTRRAINLRRSLIQCKRERAFSFGPVCLAVAGDKNTCFASLLTLTNQMFVL